MLLKNCNKKQKQDYKNRLLYLAKNKLDCVEMLVSKSVMDGIIDHNEFFAIMKEKKDYDSQKNEGDKKNKVKLKLLEKIKPQRNHQLCKV